MPPPLPPRLLSLSLQVLCLAIFDAVLVHILHAVAPDTWQARREGEEEGGRVRVGVDSVESVRGVRAC